MKKQGKIVLLFIVIVSVLLTVAGCSGGGDTLQIENNEAAELQAPGTPQNLQSSVKDGKITLKWDAVEQATGYIVTLYNTKTQLYTDLELLTKTTYTYTPKKDTTQYEFQFGVYAYKEIGDQKLYSPTLAKITAKTIEEKLEMAPALTVQIGKTAKLEAKATPKPDDFTIDWSSSDEAIATVDKDGTVHGVAEGEAEIDAAGSNGTLAKCRVTVKEKITVPDGKLVAITFDDGPGKYTGDLLDILKEHDAKATFFMLGQNVGSYSEYVQRMKDEGHELGNHSWDHESLDSLSIDGIKKEINDTNEAVYHACGAYPTVFRAPYGALSDDLRSVLTVPSIYWSIDTLDWQTPDEDYVKEQILDNVYDGAIILLHDIHETTVQGFAAAVDELQADGYTLVTVTELLNRNGESPQAGVTYYDCEKA